MIQKINFPVITFDRFAFNIVHDSDQLTRTTSAGLANALFKDLQIVDSSGNLYLVKSAAKVKGIGPFWGYNIFLNQNIRIKLVLSTETQELTLPDVKNKVITATNKERNFWSSGGNINQLRKLVVDSPSIADLIQNLGTIIN